jgi:hypothetical protein
MGNPRSAEERIVSCLIMSTDRFSIVPPSSRCLLLALHCQLRQQAPNCQAPRLLAYCKILASRPDAIERKKKSSLRKNPYITSDCPPKFRSISSFFQPVSFPQQFQDEASHYLPLPLPHILLIIENFICHRIHSPKQLLLSMGHWRTNL